MSWMQDNFTNNKLPESQQVCRRVLRFLLLKRWIDTLCVCTHAHVCFRKGGTEVFFMPLSSLTKCPCTFSFLGIFLDMNNV